MSLIAAAALTQSCALGPSADTREISAQVRRDVLRRQAVVIVSSQESLDQWMRGGFLTHQLSERAEGGSATPITDDGYFLTADHVLVHESGEADHVFLVCHQPEGLVSKKARIVWRSKKDDLALLHVEISTPHHFDWIPEDHWIPKGTRIVHGGIATAEKSSSGEIATDLRPEHALTGHRFFKMDLPLQPGDSGGPVVNADGLLVGINSAVEFLVPMETAFFVDSEGCRPNLQQLTKIIDSDRKRNNRS